MVSQENPVNELSETRAESNDMERPKGLACPFPVTNIVVSISPHGLLK